MATTSNMDAVIMFFVFINLVVSLSINSKVFNIGLNGFSRMFFCQRMTRISRILVFLSILRIFVSFVPIVLNFFVNGFHRFHGIYFSLSPDEPDEPDGWRNVISGSSGSSGDYKTTYFTKDNLFNQCNLLTKEKLRVVRVVRWQ